MLSTTFKRNFIVPGCLRGTRVRKRTPKGTPENIAQALGLQLGPGRESLGFLEASLTSRRPPLPSS
jgi:hypothetical protein